MLLLAAFAQGWWIVEWRVCRWRIFGRRGRIRRERNSEFGVQQAGVSGVPAGTRAESWEKAAQAAVERAGKSLRDLRVAEIVELDLQLDAQGKIEAYRAKLNVSFKFED